MKRVGHFLLIAVPVFVVGIVLGAIGGIKLYESAYGGVAEHIASRATTLAYLLRSRTAKEAATDAVAAQQVADWANLELVNAMGGYAQMDERFRTALDKTARVLEDDPRSAFGVDADLTRMRARAARSCILAGGAASVVQQCALASFEEIRSRYCEKDANGFEACRYPSVWSDPLKVAATSGNAGMP